MSEKPFFPPPPKTEPPYRKQAPRIVDIEPSKPAVVASRPEPPQAEEPRRPSRPSKPAPKIEPVSAVLGARRGHPGGGGNAIMVLFAKYPRRTGLGFFVLFGGFYANAVHSWVHATAFGGRAYRPGTLVVTCALATIGLWFLLFGVAFDDAKEEIPLWWWAGLIGFGIAGAALAMPIKSIAVAGL